MIFGKDRATGERAKGHYDHASRPGFVSFPTPGNVHIQHMH